MSYDPTNPRHSGRGPEAGKGMKEEETPAWPGKVRPVLGGMQPARKCRRGQAVAEKEKRDLALRVSAASAPQRKRGCWRR